MKNNEFEYIPQQSSLLCTSDIVKYRERFGLVVIDSYDIRQQDIKILYSNSIKTVFFVDQEGLDYSKSNGLIGMRLTGQEMNLKRFSVPIWEGSQYLIVNPEFRNIRENYQYKQVLKRALIFISGTDEEVVVAKKLLSCLNDKYPNITVTYISKNVENPTDFASNFPQLELEILPLSFNLDEYLKCADIVFSGGGLFKYESAYCTIPTAIISLTKLQNMDTQFFCQLGVGYDLGIFGNEVNFDDCLDRFLSNSTLRKDLHENCKKHFTTESTQNLVSELVRL